MGSTTHSSAPQFRTGNIVTPAEARVTGRKSVTVKMGRDDAPLPAFTRGLSMSVGTEKNPSSVVGHESKVRRERLATEIARTSKDEAAAPVRVALTEAARTAEDRARGIFRETNGKGATRVVRTVEMGDDALHVNRPQAVERVQVAAEPVVDRKAVRAVEDAAVRDYLTSLGYTGKIDKKVRALALAALTHAVQAAR